MRRSDLTENSTDLTKLPELAVEVGAADARLMKTRDIAVREWVRWKCRFGCENYGRSLTCPPYSPRPDETRALLQGYEYALLIRVNPDKKLHDLVLTLERALFLRGYHSALGLTAGSCKLCEECNVKGGICLKPREARPSMEACGIDVFTTARNAGYEMKVLTSRDQPYYRIALILVA
ncbi:MAG: DUF2284 domain-containing protein [Candidatus Bathyarchaeia archaeon]